jgi:hypothetical protein
MDRIMAESRISALAEQFPSLKTAPGVSPWDPDALNEWVATPAHPGDQARRAARFVLNLWDPSWGWSAGWFDVYQAFSDWDDAHRQAFLTWANDPFHPWP